VNIYRVAYVCEAFSEDIGYTGDYELRSLVVAETEEAALSFTSPPSEMISIEVKLIGTAVEGIKPGFL